MYNADQKNEFIKNYASSSEYTQKYLERIFDKSSDREAHMQKDLCNWNTQEIITFYKMQFYSSFSTVKVLNSLLNGYTEWCLRHNLVDDSQNHYNELSTQTLASCINSALVNTGIYTREQLMNNIAMFPNVGDKFLVLGLFEGIMGAGMCDFWNITLEDIHGNMISLPATNRELLISDELVKFARESADEYTYYPFLTNNEEELQKGTKNFKDDDPRVIKAMWNTTKESDAILRRRMMNRLVRLTKGDEQPYRRNLLAESGRIHALKQYMEQDSSYNIREIYKLHKDELEYRYNPIYDLNAWIIQYSKFFN